MTEKEIKILEIKNRIYKLSLKPIENAKLISKWKRILNKEIG